MFDRKRHKYKKNMFNVDTTNWKPGYSSYEICKLFVPPVCVCARQAVSQSINALLLAKLCFMSHLLYPPPTRHQNSIWYSLSSSGRPFFRLIDASFHQVLYYSAVSELCFHGERRVIRKHIKPLSLFPPPPIPNKREEELTLQCEEQKS